MDIHQASCRSIDQAGILSSKHHALKHIEIRQLMSRFFLISNNNSLLSSYR